MDLCSSTGCPAPILADEANPNHEARLLLDGRIYILVTFLPSQSFGHLSMEGKSIVLIDLRTLLLLGLSVTLCNVNIQCDSHQLLHTPRVTTSRALESEEIHGFSPRAQKTEQYRPLAGIPQLSTGSFPSLSPTL